MGALNRNQMEQVIRGGGSVLVGGHIITRVEHLPTDADLARGDPAQEQAVLAGIQAQIAALQQQHAALVLVQQQQAATDQGVSGDQGQQDQETPPTGKDPLGEPPKPPAQETPKTTKKGA